MVPAAREANLTMPEYTVGLLAPARGGDLSGVRVAVLSASYSGDVTEAS